MKVCFLGGARYSQPLDPTSAKKFRALAGLGEIFVIGFAQDMRPRRFCDHARFYLLPKWPWPVLRYLTMLAIGPWLALWVILRYDVTILVAQSPYEGLAAAWAKALARWLGRHVALVVESHGDFEESLFLQRRVGFPGLYRALMSWAARFALDRADVLRAVSNATRAQLERWAPGKPVVQFPTWTDMEVFWKRGEEPGDRQPEIVYAGVLTPLKGVHHLISAFARIAAEILEVRLVIIGRPENPEYAEALKAQVHREGLHGRVAFLGELPQGQLAERMRKGCVFVLPTLSEGLPRVVFEAMATGTPVIASRVGGIPEMVQDGINGFLVPPGDEEALAERLRWVLTHPEEVRAMGERARAFARSFFSTEAYVEGYRRLLAMAEAARQGKGPHHEIAAL